MNIESAITGSVRHRADTHCHVIEGCEADVYCAPQGADPKAPRPKAPRPKTSSRDVP
jgi:hypothetical protein